MRYFYMKNDLIFRVSLKEDADYDRVVDLMV